MQQCVASRSAAAKVSTENNSLFHCLIFILFFFFCFVLLKYPTRRFRHRNRLNAIDGLVSARYHDDDDYITMVMMMAMMMIIIIIVSRRDDFIILYRRRASRILLRRTTYLYIIYTQYRYLPTYLVPTSTYHYLYTFRASRPAVSRSVVQVYSLRSERLTRRDP